MEMSQNATVSSTNPKVSSINPTALLFGELHNLKLFRLSKHMQDQDFHLKKTTTFAWCTCSSLLLLHGWPVAQPNGNTPLPHFRNATYPPPPPPPPPKICITFVFHFSWVLQPSQEKLKTILMQTFFWRGCGGEQIRCIMANVEVLKARGPWGRGSRICWFSVEKRENGGWITQNELRGHSTPSSKSSIVKMIWTLIMRRQRPT